MKKILLLFSIILFANPLIAKTLTLYCQGDLEWKWFRGAETEYVFQPNTNDILLEINLKNKKVKHWDVTLSENYIKEQGGSLVFEGKLLDRDYLDNNSVYYALVHGWELTLNRYTGRLVKTYGNSYFHQLTYNCKKEKNQKKIF